jgi:hypothetical protein
VALDARAHETAASFRGHENQVKSAIFSRDIRRLATSGADRIVRVWQVDSGACQELPGHTAEVFAGGPPPRRHAPCHGRPRQAVWLWDLALGEVVARFPGHTSFIWSLAFSPDGATLVSGSCDATVRMWDTAPLKERYKARREAEALQPEADRLVEQLWREKTTRTRFWPRSRPTERSVSRSAMRPYERCCGARSQPRRPRANRTFRADDSTNSLCRPHCRGFMPPASRTRNPVHGNAR